MSEQIRPEHAERVRDFYRNQGAAKEQKRILEILFDVLTKNEYEEFIALIKGETK